MLLSVVILVSGFLLTNAGPAKIPEYIHTCKRNDPRVSKCVRESIAVIKPKLKSGIPEINVPSLEPLFLAEIPILRGDDSTNFRAYLRNVNVYGASDFEVTKLKMDIENVIYRVSVKIPALTLIGEYDIDARILVVPIQGKGPFSANVTDCEGRAVLKGEIDESQGFKRLKFTTFQFAIVFKGFNLHLDNLFNGDPVLSKAANDLLTENKAEFIQAALPRIERRAEELLLDIANKITNTLDYDEMFPVN